MTGSNRKSAASPDVRSRVVYIAGDGRSGSTLVNRLLGSHQECVSVGELVSVWYYGVLNNHRCGCGSPFMSCTFWKRIVEADPEVFSRAHAERMRRAQAGLLRVQRIHLLWSRAGRSYLLRRLPPFYLPTLARLYELVRIGAGGKVIIDSSKHPLYAWLIHQSGAAEVSVLHLIRDARAVAFSRTRRRPNPVGDEQVAYLRQYSPPRAALYWNLMNVSAQLLAGVLRRPSVRVRYEDLVEEPDPTMSSLVRALGLGSKAAPSADVQSHQLSGNPDRFSQLGGIRPDMEWKAGMKTLDYALVSLLSSPLLKLYGYPLLRGGVGL